MILNPKRGGFGELFAISACDAHFKSELHRNGWKQTKTTCI